MPMIYETADSRKISDGPDGKRMTVLFHISGTQDEGEVYVLMLGQSPVVIGTLVRASLAADPLGGGVWKGSVEYSSRVNEGQAAGQEPGAVAEPDAPGPAAPLNSSDAGGYNAATFAFSTSGGTAHITQSIRTVHRIKVGGGALSAPDLKQAIGVTRDTVAGCDVFAPKLEITITVQRANVTTEYVNKLKALTGRTNGSPFWNFATSECLYLGAEGQSASDGKWSVSHKIAVGEKLTNVVVCDGLTIPDLDPWDYVWCAYGDGVADNELQPRPKAVYVEQVYRSGGFDVLGIGA